MITATVPSFTLAIEPQTPRQPRERGALSMPLLESSSPSEASPVIEKPLKRPSFDYRMFMTGVHNVCAPLGMIFFMCMETAQLKFEGAFSNGLSPLWIQPGIDQWVR